MDGQGHELFRLFVGGLPRQYGEMDLRPLFAKVGRRAGRAGRQAGRRAVIASAQRLASWPRLAWGGGSADPLAAAGGKRESSQLRPLDLSPLPPLRPAPQYGNLKGVSVLREPDGSSKGCAFVLFEGRESAEEAIAALDKNSVLPGQAQPIEVRRRQGRREWQGRQGRQGRLW